MHVTLILSQQHGDCEMGDGFRVLKKTSGAANEEQRLAADEFWEPVEHCYY